MLMIEGRIRIMKKVRKPGSIKFKEGKWMNESID